MDSVAYSNFRANLKSYLKQVNENAEPLIVTNKNTDDNVVVMSKDEWDNWQETMDILSNQYLLDKIHRGEEQLQQNKGHIHELIEGP
ncbi:MAG: type II toxin-antitoxin system Phd/YefM family antitoxin [Lactobacillales bacterium]|jgi:antitoxin YefM|nr:type II toxin-antitoxin system Phd/YefM family antitoxin [Lactobacillales bacterium]